MHYFHSSALACPAHILVITFDGTPVDEVHSGHIPFGVPHAVIPQTWGGTGEVNVLVIIGGNPYVPYAEHCF
jgi:hypothetical protein